MIDTRELMRGNKVALGNEVFVVDEIFENAVSLYGCECMTYAMSLEPITITEELLLKNGFVKELLIEGNERYDDWVSYKKEVNGYFLEIRHCSNSIERDWYVHIDNESHCSVGSMDIEYVHQLQNFLTLLGINIDIEI